MGTMITLGVGKMELDWGKNNIFSDHSILFKTEDIGMVPYYYANPEDETGDKPIIEEYKEGFVRSLGLIKKRLDLLGYTLPEVKEKYNLLLEEAELHSLKIGLPYEKFSGLLKRIDIDKINTPNMAYEFDEYGYDLGEFVRRCIIPDEEIYAGLLECVNGDRSKLNADLEVFFENMDPYIILRLLCENSERAYLNVYWAYADLVEEGWVSKVDIVKPLPESKRITIVTEGSSDTKILEKAINDLYPEISDFFSFIDMEKNYPFTGTGNLYNFCCGLHKIRILNNIIAIFDNDTAGIEKIEKLKQLPQRSNTLFLKLPDYTGLNSIMTVGPNGKTRENINGRAVSIECFLDFNSLEEEPCIRWTSYSERMKEYQGSLQHKEEYTRIFLKNDIKSGIYDVSKIRFLIDYIISQWCKRVK